jgi:hypothetical protein
MRGACLACSMAPIFSVVASRRASRPHPMTARHVSLTGFHGAEEAADVVLR